MAGVPSASKVSVAKPKRMCAFVGFFGGGEELGEAGVLAEQQWEDSGGHGVEGAEVADGAFAGGAAHDINDVVRGEAGGFVDNQESVHSYGSASVHTWCALAIVSLLEG